MYKMKLNPYSKVIEEEKVYEFLEVCCQSSSNSSHKQDETVNKLFQDMTELMFFDEKKKKNYIQFF